MVSNYFTSELCSWLPPSLKKVSFSSVNNINFKSADKRYDEMISGCEKRGTKSKALEERQKLKDSIPCLDPNAQIEERGRPFVNGMVTRNRPVN